MGWHKAACYGKRADSVKSHSGKCCKSVCCTGNAIRLCLQIKMRPTGWSVSQCALRFQKSLLLSGTECTKVTRAVIHDVLYGRTFRAVPFCSMTVARIRKSRSRGWDSGSFLPLRLILDISLDFLQTFTNAGGEDEVVDIACEENIFWLRDTRESMVLTTKQRSSHALCVFNRRAVEQIQKSKAFALGEGFKPLKAIHES
jgi:hypothetical protein